MIFFTYIIKINHKNIDSTDSLILSHQTIIYKANSVFAIVEYKKTNLYYWCPVKVYNKFSAAIIGGPGIGAF